MSVRRSRSEGGREQMKPIGHGQHNTCSLLTHSLTHSLSRPSDLLALVVLDGDARDGRRLDGDRDDRRRRRRRCWRRWRNRRSGSRCPRKEEWSGVSVTDCSSSGGDGVVAVGALSQLHATRSRGARAHSPPRCSPLPTPSAARQVRRACPI